MENVDVLTIGAGGGAYPAAFRLARAGRRVVMVDPKGVMSGNCLAEGCVPSKAVREMAALRRQAARLGAAAGVAVAAPDYGAVVAHKDHVQRARYGQHAEELERAGARLRLVRGVARLRDAHTVVVESARGEVTFRAADVILASGGEIATPSVPGTEFALSSRDLYALDPNLRDLPATLVVIGGGYIGLETASFFQAFGCRVTILEMRERLLPGMDATFTAELVALLDPGIECVTGARVLRIEERGSGYGVVFEAGGAQQERSADRVLLAAGRRPVYPEGLADLDVRLGPAGVEVDAAMRTGVPGLWACGDVNGRVPLFHAAVRQSLVAAHNILGGEGPLDYFDFDAVPMAVFTLPGGAVVGLTRDAAAARGIETIEASYSFAEDSRAQILGETAGGIRLFFEAGSLRLIGGWVVGLDAEHLIGEIGLAVAGRRSAYELAAFPDQHPMAAEGICKAARGLF
ncbi:MAG: dihydrolipoyl dehydrogenase [Chromatiales bacterium 21-64-14]|nr:MAG: dihydrolipoyl dehydrogenase [Chromatiales bacterium 21-64-14]